jgi:N-acylneuraminate cytidylyltransferase
VETLARLPFLSGVHVSTDDPEIAAVAEAAGATCLSPRAARLSDDKATFIDLIRDDIPRYWAVHGGDREVLFVLATAILVPAGVYADAHRVWQSQRPDVLMSCETDFPWFAMTRKADGYWTPVFPEKVLSNTQDLPPSLVDAGLFYFFDHTVVADAPSLKLVDRLMPYMVPRDYLGDIDTAEDWSLLEKRFVRLRVGQA